MLYCSTRKTFITTQRFDKWFLKKQGFTREQKKLIRLNRV